MMSGGRGLGPAQCRQLQPGRVPNIGPAEIARRRMIGHLGLAVTVVLFAVLVVVGAPHWTRLVLVIPAGPAPPASGLSAGVVSLLAGFGSRGIYNLGPLGKCRKWRIRRLGHATELGPCRSDWAPGDRRCRGLFVAALLPI